MELRKLWFHTSIILGLSVVLGGMARLRYQMPWPSFGAGCGCGYFVLWTLTEYAVHRWIYHSPRLSRWIKHQHDHSGHHQAPEVSRLRLSGLWFDLAIGLLLTLLGLVIRVPPGWLLSILAGVGPAYLTYEWFHFVLHERRILKMLPAFCQKLARHHLRHHYDDPDVNFGITTPLWDRIFRTHVPHRKALTRGN